MGWLARHFGLACDNVARFEVVSANGEILHASQSQNPDLFRGLRGGGGNFGIVTEFEFRLHPADTADLFYRPADAPQALRRWRDLITGAPLRATLTAWAGAAGDWPLLPRTAGPAPGLRGLRVGRRPGPRAPTAPGAARRHGAGSRTDPGADLPAAAGHRRHPAGPLPAAVLEGPLPARVRRRGDRRLRSDEGEDGVRRAYGAGQMARLTALKDRYDPRNIFHLNHNIPARQSATRRGGGAQK